MRSDEAVAGHEHSLGDEADACSVSMLANADASESRVATKAPDGDGVKDAARRGSTATALQVEEDDAAGEEEATDTCEPGASDDTFQWDMKHWAMAFVAVSLLIVVVVVTLSFTLTQRLCELGKSDCQGLSPFASTPTPAHAHKG